MLLSPLLAFIIGSSRRSLFAHFAAVIGFLIYPSGDLKAHGTGENYIFISVNESSITGQFEIHFDDLSEKLGITITGDSPIQEIMNETAETVEDYILNHFSFGPEGSPYEIQFTTRSYLEVPSGKFAQYHFEIPITEIPDTLVLDHQMFYEDDRFHRGLLVVTRNSKTGTDYEPEHATHVFSRNNSRQELDLTKEIQGLMPSKAFIWQGVLHIWIGIDHILFLLVLLLPAVLRRANGQWEPTESITAAGWNILRIVTLFTIAHSITLGLSALDVISLPSRMIESLIAFSIILVALNNIFPVINGGSSILILVFGLFHGMGFASVMGELPFRVQDLVKVLLAFNVGIELGQLAIVSVAFLLLFSIRRTNGYQRIVLNGGSIVAALIALVWFVQRALAL